MRKRKAVQLELDFISPPKIALPLPVLVLVEKTTEFKEWSAGVLARQKVETSLASEFSMNMAINTPESRKAAAEIYEKILALFNESIRRVAFKLAAVTEDSHTTVNEFISIGRNTLYVNLQRWHPSQNRAFSRSLMMKTIRGDMQNHLNFEMRPVTLPERVSREILKYNRAVLRGESSEEYTASQNWSSKFEKTVLEYKGVYGSRVLDIGGSEESRDMEKTHGIQTAILSTEDNKLPEDAYEIIDRVLNQLPKREKEIVISYMGLKGQPGMTFEKISKEKGLTRERIRQLFGSATQKMKKKLDK